MLSLLPGLYSLTLDAAEAVDRMPYHSLPYSPFSQQDTSELRTTFLQGLYHQHQLALQHTSQLKSKASVPAGVVDVTSEPAAAGVSSNSSRGAAAAAGLEVLLPGCLSAGGAAVQEELQAAVDALLYRCQYLATVRHRCHVQKRTGNTPDTVRATSH